MRPASSAKSFYLTEPKSAEMGTIRGDYSHMSFGYSDAKGGMGVPNSSTPAATKKRPRKKSLFWFKPEELYDYSDPTKNLPAKPASKVQPKYRPSRRYFCNFIFQARKLFEYISATHSRVKLALA